MLLWTTPPHHWGCLTFILPPLGVPDLPRHLCILLPWESIILGPLREWGQVSGHSSLAETDHWQWAWCARCHNAPPIAVPFGTTCLKLSIILALLHAMLLYQLCLLGYDNPAFKEVRTAQCSSSNHYDTCTQDKALEGIQWHNKGRHHKRTHQFQEGRHENSMGCAPRPPACSHPWEAPSAHTVLSKACKLHFQLGWRSCATSPWGWCL